MNLFPQWVDDALVEAEQQHDQAAANIAALAAQPAGTLTYHVTAVEPASAALRYAWRNERPPLDITDEQREQFAEAYRQVSESIRHMAEQLAPVVAEFGRIYAEAARGMTTLAEQLVDKPPTDPRARALWQRQRRNTGPARRHRAPRTLGPHATADRRW